MAILEGTQIRVLVDSVQDRDEPHNEQQVKGEQTPLIGTTQKRYGMRLKSRHCCVKSKAALLVLCWKLLVIVLVGYILEYGSILAILHVTDNFLLQNNELQTLAPAFLAI